MSLTDSIDAALAAAATADARPFRIELQPDQVEALKADGLLGPQPERWGTAHGSYKEVAVYWATKDSEVLAQGAELLALRIPIAG
jgi:hypothetical protein